MNFYAPDLVYLASTSWNAIAEVSLRCKDFAIEASILRRFPFPQSELCFPGSVCLVDSMLFYSNLAEGGGISALDLVSGEHSVVLKAGESSSPHGLVALQDSIFFSDTKKSKAIGGAHSSEQRSEEECQKRQERACGAHDTGCSWKRRHDGALPDHQEAGWEEEHSTTTCPKQGW